MWVVVADNISLALSLLYSVLGLLLSGGTALINAVGSQGQLRVPNHRGSPLISGCVPDNPVLPVVLLVRRVPTSKNCS